MLLFVHLKKKTVFELVSRAQTIPGIKKNGTFGGDWGRDFLKWGWGVGTDLGIYS